MAAKVRAHADLPTLLSGANTLFGNVWPKDHLLEQKLEGYWSKDDKNIKLQIIIPNKIPDREFSRWMKFIR